jgi:hypothetical protein
MTAWLSPVDPLDFTVETMNCGSRGLGRVVSSSGYRNTSPLHCELYIFRGVAAPLPGIDSIYEIHCARDLSSGGLAHHEAARRELS